MPTCSNMSERTTLAGIIFPQVFSCKTIHNSNINSKGLHCYFTYAFCTNEHRSQTLCKYEVNGGDGKRWTCVVMLKLF